MFCDGTSNAAAAAAMSALSAAVSSRNTASAVRPGCSAVQPSATSVVPRVPSAVGDDASRSMPSTSETIGPCTVERTSRLTGSPPLTSMTSVRTASGTGAPSRRYVPASTSIRSRKKSVTSAPRLVSPQARSALWPMITPGNPENVKPETANGQLVSTSMQYRPICDQIPGAEIARCGSLASRGSPLAVCSPETTQELEPTPSPSPSRCGTVSYTHLRAHETVLDLVCRLL